MWTNHYVVDGPWRGRLAVAARPRGGDWLKDELVAWKRLGIHTILSLLTPEEERELDLQSEAAQAELAGIRFLSMPIVDRRVPQTEGQVTTMLEKIGTELSQGRSVLIHCRQGIGRSGLVAACLLITKGFSPGGAMDTVSAARGVPVPETAEQRRWIEHYASSFAGAK